MKIKTGLTWLATDSTLVSGTGGVRLMACIKPDGPGDDLCQELRRLFLKTITRCFGCSQVGEDCSRELLWTNGLRCMRLGFFCTGDDVALELPHSTSRCKRLCVVVAEEWMRTRKYLLKPKRTKSHFQRRPRARKPSEPPGARSASAGLRGPSSAPNRA